MAQLTKRRHTKSKFSKEEFYLDAHDDEKVLLFATGLLLGIGIAATILGVFMYGGLSLVVIAMTLIYIEQRARAREKGK